MPLPHFAEQSSSLFALAFCGQQPSPLFGATTGMCEHLTLHCAGLPVFMSVVHGSPSSHVVGHEAGGSQVSPCSIVLLPQLGEQSASLTEVQPSGQH
jgi:hypothetical protein